MGMNALEVRRRVMLAQPHEAVASGAIASFRTDVVSPLPMEFDLLPIQAGTGDPSPDNIRPITGHDGFTRNLTGINVWDEQYEVGNYNSTTGEKQPANNQLRAKNPIPVVPNTTYYFKGMSNGRVLFYKADGTYISSALYNNTTFTTPADCWFVTFHLGTAYGTTYKDNVGINYPATDTDYHAYVGHSYETEFPTPPGTVYGGHVRDNGDGTYDLTVTMAGRWLSTLTWANNASYANVFNGSGFTNRKIQIDGTDGVAFCDTYKFYTSYDVMDYDYGIALANTATGASRFNIYVKNKDCANKNEFVALLQEHDVFVVCPLQTPVQYTGLTLTALQSLIGLNHVWVDNADEVSVEYWGH